MQRIVWGISTFQYAPKVKISLRVTGSLLFSSALLLAIASPAAASAPLGELLTSTGADCGVLTVTPNAPLYAQDVTLSLTGATANSTISYTAAPGVIAGGRWFPVLNTDNDPSDGVIDVGDGPLLELTTDGSGNASTSGTVGELLSFPGDESSAELYTLVPIVFIAQCDAGTSYAQARGARASLTGRVSLDPSAPGSVIGAGLPAGIAVNGLLTALGDFPDPGIAVWSTLFGGSEGPLGSFQATTDSSGNFASIPFFDPALLPGDYAVALVVIDEATTQILKAEYVLTIAEDGTATLVLWESVLPDPDIPVVIEPAKVVEPTVVNISLEAAVGDAVAGSTVDYSANGLAPGSAWNLTLRSTPQVIASGTVPANGRVGSAVVIPAGLAAGWHSLTFAGTNAAGSAVESVTWFQIGAAGQLIQVSSTAPVLPNTGIDTLGAVPLAAGLLVLGFGAALLAARRRLVA